MEVPFIAYLDDKQKEGEQLTSLKNTQTGMPANILAILLLAATLPVFLNGQVKEKWYKGNTHSHTIHSDGDSTPAVVVNWYKEHGYSFLVLSDHNYLTPVDGLNSVYGAQEKFLLIPGEEVSDQFNETPIHVNGLNIRKLVPPQHGTSILDTIQNNVDAIRQVEGVPHINHPNMSWALTASHIRMVKNNKLFEIYNGYPHVHNHGGGGKPSLEKMWDDILTHGQLIYGIAVDDAHDFKGEFSSQRSNPGRGWVMVRAAELSSSAILEAMENGNFYASTGVTLTEYEVNEKKIKIEIQKEPLTGWPSYKFTTYFIGAGGRVLTTVHGPSPSYQFTGKEKYVRARVVNSAGYVAWTQPVFIDK